MRKFLIGVLVTMAAAGIFVLMIVSIADIQPKMNNTGTITRSDTEKDTNKEKNNENTPTITTKTETKTETIPYGKKTINDSSVNEGTTYISTQGQNGERTITYKVTYTDGKETERKEISRTVTKQPIDQVTTIGTRHVYTGYCQVEGTYRNRYARCYGDYSPSAYQNAVNQANYCNVNSRPVHGCYNTYR